MHQIHLADLPVSTPTMIIWAVLLLAFTAGFVQGIIHLNRTGHRRIVASIFGLLLLMGTAIHVMLLSQSSHTVTDGNWIQLSFISLVASLEMFIGRTVVFDDIIAAVIFHKPVMMMAYISIFVFIITYTLSIALLIMPRRLKDRTWLFINRKHAMMDRKNHVFLGLNHQSVILARSILKEWEATKDRSDQGDVLLVEFPENSHQHSELSIGEVFSSIFGQKKAISLENELESTRFVLLKGHMPHDERGVNLCQAIGLNRLYPWLQNPRTTLYLLSTDEEETVTLLKYLASDPSVKAKIQCYSSGANSYTSLMAAMGDRIRILNLPEMSFNEVKRNREQLHPIHFADIARDAKGEPLGYVKSASTTILIGFGEIGQEALRYLYEFGSFIGKDMQPIPNTFKVYDPSIDSIKGAFLNRTPALRYDANIEWSSSSVGTSQFWLEFAMALPSLTYVVIAVGHSQKNVEIAVQLLQEAARYGKDLSRLCILLGARQADEQMLQIIDFYNRSYCPQGVSVLHPFGMPDQIWNVNVVSGKSLKQKAMETMRTDGTDTRTLWNERRRAILSRGGNALENRLELLRKQAGDISRSLYAPTLAQLCPEALREHAQFIPEQLDPQNPVHFTGSKKEYQLFEYLAAGEHLHWMNALKAAGYIDGAGKQDELNKAMRNLVSYQDLPDEESRHICWLSVKRALMHKHQ